jgi:hypothetical protein
VGKRASVHFTLFDTLRPLAWEHQRDVYDALMRRPAKSVQSLLADPRYVGGSSGFRVGDSEARGIETDSSDLSLTVVAT